METRFISTPYCGQPFRFNFAYKTPAVQTNVRAAGVSVIDFNFYKSSPLEWLYSLS